MPDDKTVLRCRECGAHLADGLTCWELLGCVIAWEYDDPELAALHFFTVAGHNLQHPSLFTDEALDALRASFIEATNNNLPIPEIRRRMSGAFEGARRVLRTPPERTIVGREWPLTLADVYGAGDADGAADRVREWTASMVAELIAASS